MKSAKLYLVIVSLIALLASNAVAAAWTGSMSEPENMKKIDGKAYYVITTADELAWFADQVNGGKTTINAILGNDIVFGNDKSSTSSVRWTPIGKDNSHKYNGTFDGSGYTVYGVYAEALSLSGFFGVLGKDGTIKNVIAKVGLIKNERHLDGYSLVYAGGIVAYNEGTVISVSNGNKVMGGVGTNTLGKDGTNSDTIFAGGITARNDGSVINASNNATISSNSVSHAVFSGGITAYNTGNIANSDNSGNVYANGQNTDEAVLSGGIAGYNYGNVNRARNVGKIFSRGGYECCTANYKRYGDSYSGGIVAINESTVLNNVNNGIVISKAYEGDTLYTTKSIYHNQYSTSKHYINAIVASGKAKNSIDLQSLKYWLNETEIQGNAENMQKDQFAWMLNTTNGTEINSGIWTRTTSYPDFANEVNRPIYRIIFNDDGATSNRYTNNKGLAQFPDDPDPAEGFVFMGWYNTDDTRVKSTTVFSADQIVKAVYTDASDVFWTITFYNAAPADTVLESKSYQHGSIVDYGGATPSLSSTAQYTYIFKGWDVEPTNAVEDFEYHAIYDSTIRSYAITFNNTDGSKIESATFEYGKMPSCSKTPTRAATVEWTFTHKGWKPAFDYVTEAASYIAIYDSSKVEYKVVFMNGATVLDEQMVPYGDAAVAPTNVTRECYKFV